MPSRQEIENRFRFHKGTEITGPKHGELRDEFRALALWAFDNVPASSERSKMLTSLQSAMMWGNSAIALYTEPEPLRDGEVDRA